MSDPLDLLLGMMTIRAFERGLAARPDHGFQLFSSGEEAAAVGVCAALGAADQLLTSGRSLGFALARGVPPGVLMAEVLGRVAGPNRGRAGRGHIAAPETGLFGAHAVVGGNISIAAGVALAEQVAGGPGVVVVVFGDGACGAGALHETLNIAALWRLPLLFVCNNNQWSVSTPRTAGLAARKLSDLAAPFGISAETVDGTDVEAVAAATARAVGAIGDGCGPVFLELETIRLGAHSSGARETRSKQELEAVGRRCPILRLSADLRRRGLLDDATEASMREAAEARTAEAIRFAESSPGPEINEALADVW